MDSIIVEQIIPYFIMQLTEGVSFHCCPTGIVFETTCVVHTRFGPPLDLSELTVTRDRIRSVQGFADPV
jgi:hypothetical protein